MGLGNPGPEFLDTRHNAGFRLAEHLSTRWRFGAFRRGERARVAEGLRDGHTVRLLQPQTYMNRSGAALAPFRALSDFEPSRDLLILVDDVALALGRFRLAQFRHIFGNDERTVCRANQVNELVLRNRVPSLTVENVVQS